MSAGLSDCPYYRGVGKCAGQASCGFRGEPVCITDEPREGWEIESDHWWVRAFARVRAKVQRR